MLERARWTLEDRNRFSAFVFNTEFHRRWFLEHARRSGGNADLGLAALVARVVPAEPPHRAAFDWPEETDRVKVIYMVPKWAEPDHADEAIELLRRLAATRLRVACADGAPAARGESSGPCATPPGSTWTASTT